MKPTTRIKVGDEKVIALAMHFAAAKLSDIAQVGNVNFELGCILFLRTTINRVSLR